MSGGKTPASSLAAKLRKDTAAPKHGSPKREGGSSAGPNMPRNEKGGVLITKEELKVAWDFFDTKGQGKLTAAELRRRLAVFYKNISLKEVKFLMNNQSEIGFDELYDLLKDNQLTNFDPVREAFKVYDPQETGFVDLAVVKQCFQQLGYGDLSAEDMRILIQTADADGDGKIGLDDFRLMVSFGQQTDMA
ncbi:unnamed protein product [Vitrella brassicaformis CCMP3155]|uniref:EF-hand domain-containing protein n=2 Tax=Vitrella brassicaformis TaxID=1169539 RepID=A0A0G4EPG1_VITBC|nr:unnamed protein product [Vitrella brassicaformis CCMP3155]|eukprot:CEL99346.1 unnamed protein product [Vitrella brassicaformis CCMP3155]